MSLYRRSAASSQLVLKNIFLVENLVKHVLEKLITLWRNLKNVNEKEFIVGHALEIYLRIILRKMF